MVRLVWHHCWSLLMFLVSQLFFGGLSGQMQLKKLRKQYRYRYAKIFVIYHILLVKPEVSKYGATCILKLLILYHERYWQIKRHLKPCTHVINMELLLLITDGCLYHYLDWYITWNSFYIYVQMNKWYFSSFIEIAFIRERRCVIVFIEFHSAQKCSS